MLRVVEDLGGGAALHDLAAVHHDGLVGELAHDGQVVADQDVGHPGPVADLGQQVQHLGLDRHVKRGDRLVQDQHARLSGQGPGDRHPLPLPAGQGPGQRPRLPAVQADQFGQFRHPGPAPVGGPVVVQPDHLRQRLLGGLPRVQAGVRILEHDLDLAPPASPVAGGPGRPGAVVSAGGDGAASGVLEPDDHPGDRGLAGTGLPHDRQRARRRDREGHVVDRDELAELLAQAGHRQDWLRHRRPPVQWSPARRPPV